MNADLSALLLAKAKKLPSAPKPTVQRGRYSSNRHLYESALPAIDVALASGMSLTDTTTWLLQQFTPELLSADHGFKRPGWWRWYQFIRRRSIKIKAAQKTTP